MTGAASAITLDELVINNLSSGDGIKGEVQALELANKNTDCPLTCHEAVQRHPRPHPRRPRRLWRRVAQPAELPEHVQRDGVQLLRRLRVSSVHQSCRRGLRTCCSNLCTAE